MFTPPQVMEMDRRKLNGLAAKAFSAIGVGLLCLGFIPGCTTTCQTYCAGTGVTDPTADVSIEIGDLVQPDAAATLTVGQILFVGSNGCASYGLSRLS
jgi:hypothetical protein